MGHLVSVNYYDKAIYSIDFFCLGIEKTRGRVEEVRAGERLRHVQFEKVRERG